MSFQSAVLFSLALLGSPAAGTILWDGRSPSMTDLENWSFSNEVGDYQYYIHGDSNITSYVNMGSEYQNPADTGSSEGIKITLDSTAYWEGQTMRRTELIPQTTATINSGKVYYHFSMSRSDTNAPSENREHQIAFFESHFTEMKAGWISGESGTSDASLRWMANSESQWNVTWEADVWHNVAYGIDFSAGTVEFYHSTGSDDLTLTVPAVTVSASSNGADWHIGALELARDGYDDTTEDFFFSGVYIESGDVTLSVSGPGSNSSSASSSTSAAASSVASTSTAAGSTAVAAVSTVASTSSDVPATKAAVTSSAATSATTSAALTTFTPTTLATVVASSSAKSTDTLSSATSTATFLPIAEEIADEVGATTTNEKIAMWMSQVMEAMVVYLAGEDADSSS